MSASIGVDPGQVWRMCREPGALPSQIARTLHVHPSVVFAALEAYKPAADADELRHMKASGENHFAGPSKTREQVQAERAAYLLARGEPYGVIRERLGIHHAQLEKLPEYAARKRQEAAEQAALEAAVFRMAYEEKLNRDAVCTKAGLHLTVVMTVLRREWSKRNPGQRFATPFAPGGWKALKGQSKPPKPIKAAALHDIAA
jgi:hypothetical protein